MFSGCGPTAFQTDCELQIFITLGTLLFSTALLCNKKASEIMQVGPVIVAALMKMVRTKDDLMLANLVKGKSRFKKKNLQPSFFFCI